MKSYVIIEDAQLNNGAGKIVDGQRRFDIVPDPKREGLYKVTYSSSLEDFKRKWSWYYGKCNQGKIQEMIKRAVEV